MKVYGTVDSPTVSGEAVTSTYTLDGSGATPYSSAELANSITTTEADGVLFFDSGTLSDGAHVLVINVTSASSSSERPFFDGVKGLVSSSIAVGSSSLT